MSLKEFERLFFLRRKEEQVQRAVERMRDDEARLRGGYVYFLQCEAFVKIGYSSNPKRRLRALEVMCPFPCTLMGMIPGGKLDEARIHADMKASHHRGEWFHLTAEVEAAIATLLRYP